MAITVNSVLAPSLSAVDEILGEIAGTLKPGGLLAGIFPSLESVLYEGVLILDREREQSEAKRSPAAGPAQSWAQPLRFHRWLLH